MLPSSFFHSPFFSQPSCPSRLFKAVDVRLSSGLILTRAHIFFFFTENENARQLVVDQNSHRCFHLRPSISCIKFQRFSEMPCEYRVCVLFWFIFFTVARRRWRDTKKLSEQPKGEGGGVKVVQLCT